VLCFITLDILPDDGSVEPKRVVHTYNVLTRNILKAVSDGILFYVFLFVNYVCLKVFKYIFAELLSLHLP
jgi:hypothetical protein